MLTLWNASLTERPASLLCVWLLWEVTSCLSREAFLRSVSRVFLALATTS